MKNLKYEASKRFKYQEVRSKSIKGYYIYMEKHSDAFEPRKIKPIYEVLFEEGKSHYFESKLKANKFFDKKVKQLKDLLS